VRRYSPLFLVFAYLVGTTLLLAGKVGFDQWPLLMNHFMGGFFLTFSFFKFLNLKGFAKAYATYDVIAKRWIGYGYLYPFIELGLGILYVIGCCPVFTNWATVIVMGVSAIGVLESLIHRREIKCACLGTFFDLPMSTVTLVEDLLMVAMAAAMLVFHA
jgi:hypothetical protein